MYPLCIHLFIISILVYFVAAQWNQTNLRRSLLSSGNDPHCGANGRESMEQLQSYSSYFDGMKSIYRNYGNGDETCLPVHRSCGWPRTPQPSNKKRLPLFVLSVGLEGAGHHLWTEILDVPVVDCLWINGRHYHRDIGDGVPRTTVEELKSGLMEQFSMRAESGQSPCRTIYDAEDSFPTGAIRKPGRVFMRPDIINLQQLDGKLIHVKYLIILRNVTDTTLSALRRNFFTNVDAGIRTVEHTLTYLEAAMRSAPCSRTFIAHYEHALTDPAAFLSPLASFLELGVDETAALKKRLFMRSEKGGKRRAGDSGGGLGLPRRKEHKLGQYAECKDAGMGEHQCYKHVSVIAQSASQSAFFSPLPLSFHPLYRCRLCSTRSSR